MDDPMNTSMNKNEQFKKRVEASKMESKIDVNDDDFENEVIKKSEKVPVVVDFWAEWCMPCRMLGPVLEKFAETYGGKFILAKANIDETQLYATEYGVMSIPSVKLFKGGAIVDDFVGVLPEDQIRSWLERNL